MDDENDKSPHASVELTNNSFHVRFGVIQFCFVLLENGNAINVCGRWKWQTIRREICLSGLENVQHRRRMLYRFPSIMVINQIILIPALCNWLPTKLCFWKGNTHQSNFSHAFNSINDQQWVKGVAIFFDTNQLLCGSTIPTQQSSEQILAYEIKANPSSSNLI